MNLQILFHFHNRSISLIQASQMEYKWNLVILFLFPLNARDIFLVISRCNLLRLKRLMATEFFFLFSVFVNIHFVSNLISGL